MNEYEVTLECRFERELTDLEQDLFRDALLAALDKAGLPYEVDIATAGMREV